MEKVSDLNKLFSIVPAMVCIASPGGYFEYLNPEWEKVLGFSLEELSSRPLFDFIHPDDHERTWGEIDRQLQGNATINFENRYRCKDGSYKILEWRATPAKGGKLYAVAVDVTDRKKTEERYKGLFDSIRDAILVADINRSIIDCNPAFRELFGYSFNEIKGQKTLYLYENEEQFQELGKALREHHGKTSFLKTVNYKKKNGEVFPGETGVFYLNNKKDEVVGFIGLIRDISERKHIEDALRKSDKLFRTAVSELPIAMIVSEGVSEKVLAVNRKFTELFGYTIEDIPDVSAWWPKAYPDNAYRDEVRTIWTEIIEKAIADQAEVKPLEVTITCKDNTEKQIIVQAASVAEINLVTFIDQTERKRTEMALHESEKRLSAHLENTPVGAISWNLDFEVVDWNPAAETIFGYTKKEAIGKHAADLIIPEEIKDEIDKIFEKLLAKTGGTHSTNEDITKNRRRIICDWYNTTIKDPDGNTIGVSSFVHDITERVNTAKELINKKEAAQRYLNLAGVMFIGLDQKGNVTIANKKACTVLECDENDIIGQNWFDNFIPFRIREDVRSVFNQLIVGDVEPVEYFENPVVSKKGDEKQIAWHNTILTDGQNKIIGTLGSGEDITEKRKLQAQLEQSQKMEAIGNLAGGIAHDFNNILSSVIGFTELALDDVEKGTTLEDYLQEVYTGGKRARDLVKQILAFARQSDEERKPLQIGNIAKEVLKLIRSTIPATIEIRENIESDSLVMGNASHVHQLFMNLCTNAAQAMEGPGGVLKVRLTDVNYTGQPPTLLKLKAGNYIKITVSDTGTGISPDIIDSIFEPYFTTKGVGEGTGMGLAMSHGIVEGYGGKITVDSALGEGTTFKIYLPVSRRRKIHRQYEPEQLPEGTERILFIDDEAPIAKMGSQGLERLGYNVTIRTSSVEGLELFKTKPNDFDIVITDMTMPNITGDKLSVELLKIRPDIPVILCSGYSKKISDDTVLNIGIKAFAYKPIVKADLAKIVRKVLDEAKGKTSK